MRVLLDTHVFLWWFAAPERLGRRAKRLIGDGRNDVLLSAASCWELAIKAALGKLVLPEPVERYVPARLAAQGMGTLAVDPAHALRVATLPPLHRDPFDRLIVCQALIEELPLVTADTQLAAYGAPVIDATK
ncbi:MAG: type II toxin-antitoxin system VapC family toxin [Thermoanaerobaculaceae bacterium]|nr:type II toxin-antitoxin system VapC family toxin [Thermoanaerobaculaceae bacterium]